MAMAWRVLVVMTFVGSIYGLVGCFVMQAFINTWERAAWSDFSQGIQPVPIPPPTPRLVIRLVLGWPSVAVKLIKVRGRLP